VLVRLPYRTIPDLIYLGHGRRSYVLVAEALRRYMYGMVLGLVRRHSVAHGIPIDEGPTHVERRSRVNQLYYPGGRSLLSLMDRVVVSRVRYLCLV